MSLRIKAKRATRTWRSSEALSAASAAASAFASASSPRNVSKSRSCARHALSRASEPSCSAPSKSRTYYTAHNRDDASVLFRNNINARTRARRASCRAPPSRMAPSAAARAASAAAASRRASPAAAVASASRATATAAASDAVVFAATASAAATTTAVGQLYSKPYILQRTEPSYLRPGRRPARPPGAPSAQPAWPNADEPPPGPRSAMAQ
jgi:hypothetical protein